MCQDDPDRRRQLKHDVEGPAKVRRRHLVQEERDCLIGEPDADAERDAAEHERDERGRAQRRGGRGRGNGGRGRGARRRAVVEEAGAGGHGGADEEGEARDEHRGLAAAPEFFF